MSPISALTSTAAQTADPATSALTGGVTPSKDMFLQLLVAQIKNQDPLSPTDSTQFVSQLAQFSQLEQVIGIRQDIEAAGTAGTGSTTNTNSSNSTTQS